MVTDVAFTVSVAIGYKIQKKGFFAKGLFIVNERSNVCVKEEFGGEERERERVSAR